MNCLSVLCFIKSRNVKATQYTDNTCIVCSNGAAYQRHIYIIDILPWVLIYSESDHLTCITKNSSGERFCIILATPSCHFVSKHRQYESYGTGSKVLKGLSCSDREECMKVSMYSLGDILNKFRGGQQWNARNKWAWHLFFDMTVTWCENTFVVANEHPNINILCILLSKIPLLQPQWLL